MLHIDAVALLVAWLYIFAHWCCCPILVAWLYIFAHWCCCPFGGIGYMLHIGAVAHLVALDTCCTLVLLPIWWHWIHVAQRYCLPVWWQWIHILVLVQLMLIATRWLGDACSQVAFFYGDGDYKLRHLVTVSILHIRHKLTPRLFS